MIETVARALERAEGGTYETIARAAIEAMREPTPKMIAEAWNSVTPAKKLAGISRLGPGPGVSEVWRAMIDAALQEPTP